MELADDESQVGGSAEEVQYYEVTIACRTDAPGEEAAGYTFRLPGPSSRERMVRWMCYCDNALLGQGTNRQQLLEREYGPSRTDRMFQAIVNAYQFVCKSVTSDEFPVLYFTRAVSVDALELVHSPALIRYLVAPEPIRYPAECIDTLEALRKRRLRHGASS